MLVSKNLGYGSLLMQTETFEDYFETPADSVKFIQFKRSFEMCIRLV